MLRHIFVLLVAAAVVGCESDQNRQAANTDQKNQDFHARSASARMEAQLQTPQAPNQMDARQFVQEASSSGWFEVKSAELAKQRATSDRTKVFADHMITDHKKANDDLAKIAEKQNIELASDLQPKEKAQLDKLASINGSTFDSAFIQSQVQAHQQAIALFENASKNLQDKQLKEFADQYLPTLREHLKMAQDEAQYMSSPDQLQKSQQKMRQSAEQEQQQQKQQ
jgi:putative membrane protein